jgi:hypothetical protein
MVPIEPTKLAPITSPSQTRQQLPGKYYHHRPTWVGGHDPHRRAGPENRPRSEAFKEETPTSVLEALVQVRAFHHAQATPHPAVQKDVCSDNGSGNDSLINQSIQRSWNSQE